jgi:hypothetical protein
MQGRPLRSPLLILVTICCVLTVTTFKLHELINSEFSREQTLSLKKSFRPLERGLPLVAQQNKTDRGFSACLLVMDDNHFLIEWLAYHYFTLRLRHLIVAVDPRSETSPDSILNRWNDRIEIQKWNDQDFMTDQERDEAENDVRMFFKAEILKQQDLIRHRARQRLFYYKCMKQIKEQGRDWVLLIDTDEFIRINYSTVKTLGIQAPPISSEGSIPTFLASELQRPGHNLTTPCIQIPRMRFGAKESSPFEVSRQIHKGFNVNASHFQTLRWRKHARPTNRAMNKISKTMIHVGRVGTDELTPVNSIHRPVRTACGHRRLYIQSQNQVFVIHHYVGTREQYARRNDSRAGKERSMEAFHKLADLEQGVNDELRPWLVGFFGQVGVREAQRLLESVGVVE